MSISGETEQIVMSNKQIKWTEVARRAIREEAIKLKKMELLAKYLDKKPITAQEWALMEKMDFHPVDEVELKDGFARHVLKARSQKGRKANSVKELFE